MSEIEVSEKSLYDLTAFELAHNNKDKRDIWNLHWWKQKGFRFSRIKQQDFMGWMTVTSVIAQEPDMPSHCILGNPDVPNRIFIELPPGDLHYEITR